MSKEIENKVDALLQSYGVPFSARYSGEVTKADWGIDGKGQRVDAWRVNVGGFETDYFSGLGNRGPAPKPTDGGPPPRRGTLLYEQLEALREPVTPSAAGVLYGLLLDAAAGGMSFSEWCGEFDYSDDSIKALNIYKQCEETARELGKVFSGAQMAELREALQDY